MRQPKNKLTKSIINLREQFKKHVTLLWRLFNHSDVPLPLKIIPIISVLYWFNPVDIIPVPFLGLTPFDDLAAVMLGSQLFLELAPADVLQRLRDEIYYGLPQDDDDEVIDTTYHFMDDDH